MVFQGERKMASSNRLLGKFDLTGIPPAPRGVPQIEVKFDIDQNGILNVSAKDLGTGTEANVEIKESSGLSDDEIKQMQADAEAHADEDRRRYDLAVARNSAEHMILEMEKTMEEHAEKLSENDKAPMEAAIAKVREAATGEDPETINSAVKELEQAAHAFSKAMYESSGATDAPQQEGGEQPAAAANDDAIDAEFEVKND